MQETELVNTHWQWLMKKVFELARMTKKHLGCINWPQIKDFKMQKNGLHG